MRATRENIMKRLLLLFLLCFGLVLPGVAADGTSFNPTTISVKSVGASIPVGTVITWPSNSWPSDRDNWLECIFLGYYHYRFSVSGTGRAHRVERPELSGSVPPGIRWPNQLSLWRCWPLERRVRRAARGWNTRNMGRAFLSAPKPRWRSGPVRFTGLLERRAESMDE